MYTKHMDMAQMTGCAHVTYDGLLTLRAWKPKGSSHPGTIINQSDSLEQSWDRPACLWWLSLDKTDFILPADAPPLN